MEQAEDWNRVPVFGTRPVLGTCLIRPSAYTLIENSAGCIAVVRTGEGTFLPGGGIEDGETPDQAILREALEECGFIIRLGEWAVHAVQFAYSQPARSQLEKRSTFIEGNIEGYDTSRLEADHELIWLLPAEGERILTHASHVWAVAEWSRRTIRS